MNRYHDIQELLGQVTTHLDQLKAAYDAARKDEDIKQVLRPLVKSSLEHLRSCLEYCGQEIAAINGPARGRFYFPYGENERNFKRSSQKNFPALDKNQPALYALIEGLQPHMSGNGWLVSLCEHTNFNKHDRLSMQQRVESDRRETRIGPVTTVFAGDVTVTLPDGSTARFGDETPVADIKAQLRNNKVRVSREFDWVEFRFPGSAHDALRLIETSHREIGAFASRLKAELDKGA